MASNAPQVRYSSAVARAASRSLPRVRRPDAAALRIHAQRGARWSLWVKYKTEGTDRYFAANNTDPSTTVYEFVQRLVSEEELRVRPSHVTLRWPKCGPSALDGSQEALAVQLEPWRTLLDAGVEDGHVLLADIGAAQGGCTEGAPWLRAPRAVRPACGRARASVARARSACGGKRD